MGCVWTCGVLPEAGASGTLAQEREDTPSGSTVLVVTLSPAQGLPPGQGREASRRVA